ncbi:PREDICTED: UPF0160 protein MYG1, mitochondrial-like [Amphimedon queenslandica]|uniref:Uncharacterized protein n=1 Tax=Amphimedon queenslandica TaxID=400682 RepID=A0A1X7V6F7_AMPQE|nr:PREDICTED: UPF0160 protein MYG1, mitochondrial-like [Amphimedon queenslandica]|eukprot:XP_011403086.2 PREDICTED: UPF0160 protein MYG1, mitochondrial-like [Amphimedon queenslandica]
MILLKILRVRHSTSFINSCFPFSSVLRWNTVMSIPKIGTHNGKFHCDEVLACYMLKVLPEYQEAAIVRSRDPQVLDKCDIVVDVGAVYDHDKLRYDHHQRGFNETMHSLSKSTKPWTTKLSSAGLIYYHYGERVLSALTGFSIGSSELASLYDAVYNNFIEEIDAVDNGIQDREGIPKYKITSTIGYRVSRLNSRWNDTDHKPDERFKYAMERVGEEFNDIIQHYKDSWLPARSIVLSAIEKRHEVDASGEVINLEQYCPWVEHLLMLESQMNLKKTIKFVLYPEESGKWRVQAVPLATGSFVNRVSLLEEWRGLRDQELSDLSGIPGCVFVHANGFIGGNSTLDGALSMAMITLQNRKK